MIKMRTAKVVKKKGYDYISDDEKYDKKEEVKEERGMKTAGIATKLKQSENEEGYSNKPKVKPQKKNSKIVIGQKRVYK